MNKLKIMFLAAMSFAASGTQLAEAQILRGGLVESALAVQSPEVASMAGYADRPVTYFNGTVPVTIPLCEVTADGFTLPITLTYCTSGFRPSQEATWVGLGWSLSLNACISRYIKCVDDFLEYNNVRKGFFGIDTGYYDSSAMDYYDMTEHNLAYKCPYHQYPCGDDIYATDLVVDSEPDIFSVSLWDCTDKFVLNIDSTSSVSAIFMDRPYGNVLRILTREERNRTVHYFELVRNDGTIYEFGRRELTCTLNYPGQRCFSDFHPADIFEEGDADLNASAWFLTKITMPSGRSITFEYETEIYEAATRETCMKFRPVSYHGQYNQYSELVLPTMSGTVPFYEQDAVYSSSKTEIETARLKNIIWDSGAAKINFCTSERRDMYKGPNSRPFPQKLDSIRVFDASDNLVHCYRLCYGYFGGQSCSESEKYLYERLRLDSIEDMLTPGRVYSFKYDESRPFPSKMTSSVDYWGYYNGKNYGDAYYCQTYEANSKKLYSGADKSSDSLFSRLGVLDTIFHPTGGYETFEYESNRFLWPRYVQDGGRHLQTLAMTSLNLPGQYINELENTISQNSSMSITLDGTLTRQSGSTGWSGTLVSITNTETGSTVWSYSDAVTSPGGNNGIVQFDTKRVSLPAGSYRIKVHLPAAGWISYWQVDVSEGTPVTYRCDMIETGGAGLRIKRITGGGKTREFNYSLGELMVDPIFSQIKTMSGTIIDADPYFITSHPCSLNCLIQYSESIIPQSTVAKGYLLGYEEVSERVTGAGHDITTNYSFSLTKEPRRSLDPQQSTMPIFSNGLLESRTVVDNGSTVGHEEYYYDVGTSANIRAYDFSYVNGLTSIPNYRFKWYVPLMTYSTADGLTTLTCCSYNDNWLLSCKSISCLNGSAPLGVTERVSYSYTCDFQDDSVCRQMSVANILAPVRELIYLNNGLSSGSMVRYRKENGRFLPDTLFEAKLDATSFNVSDNYRVHTTYDRYDNMGNPIQVTRDGITTLYVWGYKGQYPVAEIVGSMNYDQLEGFVGTPLLEDIHDRAVPADAQFSSLDSLRIALPVSAPGSLMTIRRFKPLVGVSSETAPNGMTTRYSYDSAGRLTEIRRSGGGTEQLLERYSYNLTGSGSGR